MLFVADAPAACARPPRARPHAALGALPALWDLSVRVREASGEPTADLQWSLKKPGRIRFKLLHKYNQDRSRAHGEVEKVTDVARTSIIFSGLEPLARAARIRNQHEAAVGYKNRIASPTDEKYHDMLFTVDMGGHICEVQLHFHAMHDAKKIGHALYKLCRRVELFKPPGQAGGDGTVLVKEHYEGKRNPISGKPHGWGTMYYPDGR